MVPIGQKCPRKAPKRGRASPAQRVNRRVSSHEWKPQAMPTLALRVRINRLRNGTSSRIQRAPAPERPGQLRSTRLALLPYLGNRTLGSARARVAAEFGQMAICTTVLASGSPVTFRGRLRRVNWKKLQFSTRPELPVAKRDRIFTLQWRVEGAGKCRRFKRQPSDLTINQTGGVNKNKPGNEIAG